MKATEDELMGLKDELIEGFEKLSPAKQEEVIDFIEYLSNKQEKSLVSSIEAISSQSECFNFLKDEEDLYSTKDLRKTF